MPKVKCTHCDAENDPHETGGYCEECGKKLPSGLLTTAPRLEPSPRPDRDEGFSPDRPRSGWRDRDLPDDLDFRREDSQALKAAKKQASGVLFAIAALQLLCNTIAVLFAPGVIGAQNLPPEALAFAMVLVVGIAVVFAGLGVWARFQPLPASIIGLVLYVLLIVADFVGSPETAFKGIVLKVLFVVFLARAIGAASKAGAPGDRHPPDR